MNLKNVRPKLSSLQEFAVLLFSEDAVRGCWFRKKNGRFILRRYGKESVDHANPAAAWKKLRKQLGFGGECILFLSGSIGKKAMFCRTTVPALSGKEMAEALRFDLSRLILRDSTDDIIQYTPAGSSEDGTELQVNLYAFPPEELDSFTAILSQSIKKADYFLYPLMPLRLEDGPLRLPEAEPDFFFADGQWHDIALWKDAYYEPWENQFKERFQLPEGNDFKIREYLGCLLIARFASSSDFSRRNAGIKILSPKFRPGRLRNQLRLTVLLLILLASGLLWKYGGQFYRESREMSQLEAQKAQLSRQLRQIKQKLKSNEKTQKELQRILNQKRGENHIVEKLAAFSGILPSNVMVQNMRWSENSLDLTLQSEAENLNIPALFRSVKYWKIVQMQERRRNNEATRTITLKLAPAEGAVP